MRCSIQFLTPCQSLIAFTCYHEAYLLCPFAYGMSLRLCCHFPFALCNRRIQHCNICKYFANGPRIAHASSYPSLRIMFSCLWQDPMSYFCVSQHLRNFWLFTPVSCHVFLERVYGITTQTNTVFSTPSVFMSSTSSAETFSHQQTIGVLALLYVSGLQFFVSVWQGLVGPSTLHRRLCIRVYIYAVIIHIWCCLCISASVSFGCRVQYSFLFLLDP
jgi:hypothetical protein